MKVSRIVYLRQKPGLFALPGDDLTAHKRKLGGSIKGNDVLRGLTSEEEKKYLQDILGVQASSAEWNKAVKGYWSDISVLVPAGEGVKLEVGMEYANEKDAEANKNGTPINLANFITYRFALVHSKVANNYADIGKSPKIEFYLFSKDQELDQQKKAFQARQKAITSLYTILPNRDLTRDVYVLLSATAGNNLIDISLLTPTEVDVALENLARTKPFDFNTVAGDSSLEMKSFIERCISAGHLRRIENTDTIVFGETTVVAQTLADAVIYFSDPANAEKVAILKAKLTASKSVALQPL